MPLEEERHGPAAGHAHVLVETPVNETGLVGGVGFAQKFCRLGQGLGLNPPPANGAPLSSGFRDQHPTSGVLRGAALRVHQRDRHKRRSGVQQLLRVFQDFSHSLD